MFRMQSTSIGHCVRDVDQQAVPDCTTTRPPVLRPWSTACTDRSKHSFAYLGPHAYTHLISRSSRCSERVYLCSQPIGLQGLAVRPDWWTARSNAEEARCTQPDLSRMSQGLAGCRVFAPSRAIKPVTDLQDRCPVRQRSLPLSFVTRACVREGGKGSGPPC